VTAVANVVSRIQKPSHAFKAWSRFYVVMGDAIDARGTTGGSIAYLGTACSAEQFGLPTWLAS
jgi:hypothetical protein